MTKQFKLRNKFEDRMLSEQEFTEWFNTSLAASYDSAENCLRMARDSVGEYYIGAGYYLSHTFPEDKNSVTKTEDTEKCSHKNKYLNKISTALQFWVCPDCKKEVSEKEVSWDGWMPF